MTSSVHVTILSSNSKIYNEYGLSFIAQAPQNILQFDITMDVTMRVDKLKVFTALYMLAAKVVVNSEHGTIKYSPTLLLHDRIKSQTLEDIIKGLQAVINDKFMEVPNFSQKEFEVLCHMIDEECPDIPQKPNLQVLSMKHLHISELNSVLSHFQQVSYPHNIIHIQVSMNSNMEEKLISAIPDLALVILLMKGNKIQCFPLIVECAFSQPCKKVFEKVAMLIGACPEVLMVIIVLINESPCYQSPSEKSLAWKTFVNHQDPLDLTGFMSLCDVDSGDVDVEEDFMVPVVAAGHTWCHISSCIPNTGDEGSSSELPRNKNLDHFDRLLNKGLEMIQLDIIQFCQEIAMCHNLPVDYSGLEEPICLPSSWDHFCSALGNAGEITTHALYMHWYKDLFRGKKQTTTEPDITLGNSRDEVVEHICKCTVVGGWEVGQRHVEGHVSDVLSQFDFSSQQKEGIKVGGPDRELLEGPDAVQHPEVLGPCKHCPPCHFTPGEDDPDPSPAPI
ncbi:hypothetical protein EDC04DRAFT_2611976 [Pisolithus marmoratus]|nr:hypothetical protein EDC04DRAFT_2611976 [Pisolithus marmoratus]